MSQNDFGPEYTTTPGEVMVEQLQDHDISIAEFAHRSGYSRGFLKHLIAGNGRIGLDIALEFEKATGFDHNLLLHIEREHWKERRKIEGIDPPNLWG